MFNNSNQASKQQSRFNNWVHEDDVENTNEQIELPSNSLFSNRQPTLTSFPVTSSIPSASPFTVKPPPIQSSIPSSSPFTVKPPPIQSSIPSSSPFTVKPPPITTPLFSTPSWSFTTTPSPLTTTPKMHTINREPLYNRRQYRGTLETTKTVQSNLKSIEYITISDVFVYVTLGMTICDTYLEELTEIITNEITNYTTIKIDETTFNGKSYKREIPVFSFEHYGIIAKHCLEWALCNPEKLGHL